MKIDLKKELYGVNIKLDVLETSFDLIIGSRKLADEYTNTKCDYLTEKQLEGVNGYVTEYGDLYLKDRKRVGTIAHEAVHLAMFLANTRNLNFSPKMGEHEIIAYLVGYIVESIAKQKRFYKYEPKSKTKFPTNKFYVLPSVKVERNK